jgi:hypothetical protein
MKNGVFFRLELSIPKKSVAAWRKAKLREARAHIPEDLGERAGDAIFGGELSVQAKALAAALRTMEQMGLPLERSAVAHWDKITIDGEPHVRIETKGAVLPHANVGQLLDYLQQQTDAGKEFVRIERDGADGRVDIWGYLGGHSAYADHWLPLLTLGVAAARVKGEGQLVFLGDVELTDDSVFVLARFSSDGELEVAEELEPQDITEEQAAELTSALGKGGEARIRKAHGAWLSRFGAKKKRRSYAGRTGWLRPDGSFAIEPRFRSAGQFEEGLAFVSERGPFDYGYIDSSGELVIAYRFFSAGGHKQGRALVQVELGREQLSEHSARVSRAYGYIDPQGELVIPARYESAEDFSEERAVVGDSELRGYIDPDGREILPCKYRTARAFADGMGLIAEHDEYETGGFGFVDREGKITIPLSLQQVGTFHQGFAPAARASRWGILDKQGKWVLEPRFERTGYLVADRLLVMLAGKWGLVDGSGRTVIECKHGRLGQLLDWFVGNDDEDNVFYSREGAELFRVPYDVLGEPRDGRIGIANSYDGPWGYMDFEGRIVIEPRFQFAAPFSDGLAIVEDENGKWGIIDDTGKLKTPFDFRLFPSAGASHFAKNGLAYIESGSRFGLVNREGRVLHQPVLEAMFGFGEDLIYARYPEDHD